MKNKTINWTKHKLEEICIIIAGQSPNSGTYNREKIGLPFYQGKADFGLISPTPTVWCSEPIKIAEKGDILLSVRAPVGPTNLSNEKCCIGRGLCAIRTHEDIYRKFIIYYFKLMENEISKMGNGSTFQAITIDDVKNFIILLPSYSEQKHIADIIETRLQIVEKAKEAVNKQLELTGLLFDAYISKIYDRKKYRNVRLDEISLINPTIKGKMPQDDNMQVSFVPMSAVDAVRGEIANEETRSLSQVRKGYSYFESDDILFAKITPCMQNGKHLIVNNLKNGIGFGSTEFHVIRPLENVMPEWIHFYLRQKKYLLDAENNMQGTVGQQRLPESHLRETTIPLPSVNEQRIIIEDLKSKYNKIKKIMDNINEQLSFIDALQSSILRQAFRGEL